MDGEARFRLQQQGGSILAAAALILGIVHAATFSMAVHRFSIAILAVPSVYHLLAIGVLAIPTVIVDHELVRALQSGIFATTGIDTILIEEPEGIVFFIYGLFLALRFGLLRRHAPGKLTMASLAAVAAAFGSALLHHHSLLGAAAEISLATACLVSLLWFAFSETADHDREEADRLRREATANQVFVRFGRNVAGVVHNLKSKLMSIEGFNDLIVAENHESPEATTDYAILQQRGFQNVHDMIDGLLLAVRSYQRSEPEVFSLAKLIGSAVEMLRANREVRGGVAVDLDLCRVDEVYAPPLAVIQVLDGLIQNAWEAMDESAEKRISITTQIDGPNVKCCIRDRGAGIAFCSSCRHEDCLVCRHFQIGRSEKPEGSGIGVVQVQALIREMGGKLSYTSGQAMGTTVCAWFPRGARLASRET